MEKLEERTAKLSVKLGNRIEEGDPNVFRISCTTRKKTVEDAYVDPDSPIIAISRSLYNEAFTKQATFKGFNLVGMIRKVQVVVGGLIYNPLL